MIANVGIDAVRGTLVLLGIVDVFLTATIFVKQRRGLRREARMNKIVATVAPIIGLMRALERYMTDSDSTPLTEAQQRALFVSFQEQARVFYAALGIESE